MTDFLPTLKDQEELKILTHKDLTHLAYRWLKNHGYGVALCEYVTTANEVPDAIGFKSRESAVVECKRTRSDFLADKKKFFRHYPESGMGNMRYFMTPKGLIRPDELPDNWGLIEVQPSNRCRTVVPAIWQKRDDSSERYLLYSIVRRIEIRGLLHHALSGQSLEAHNLSTEAGDE